MPALPTAATEYYRQQQRLTTALLATTRRLWRDLGPDFEAGWTRLRPRLVTVVAAAQLGAARAADPYISAVLAELDIPDRPTGSINARRFAGIAVDGRPLDSMLYGSVVAARSAAAGGMSTSNAAALGGRWLDMAVQTAVADAGRSSVATGIIVRPDVEGYVRLVNLPACSRCLILSGRFYRWDEGFARHPRCDCRHIPATKARSEELVTSPTEQFKAMSRDEQDKAFGQADAEAIRGGADLYRTVNAHRSGRALDASTWSVPQIRDLMADPTSPIAPPSPGDRDARRDRVAELMREFGLVT